MHIHLDPIGGFAGDMFCAAMIDAFPALAEPMMVDLDAAGLLSHVAVQTSAEKVNGMAARQFHVNVLSTTPRPTGHYEQIRQRLCDSALVEAVRDKALAVFDHLARAEAIVHQVSIERVHFHEVADWDSLTDIVAAASLIHHSGVTTWSCAALPLGSGTIQTEHGRLPVPAPATLKLLTGFEWIDDSEVGERVTPTGAAILRSLMCTNGAAARHRPAGRLRADGTGCGTRRFESVPNVIRLFAIERRPEPTDRPDDQIDEVATLSFEVDDMTPEELATAMTLLQNHDQVLDAGYHLRIGKKGRPQFSIQVLSQPDCAQEVADLCLTETSTLGVRTSYQKRRVLARQMTTLESDGLAYPVKQARRPDGSTTAKVEADALQSISGLKQRRRISSLASDPHPVDPDSEQA